jgi:hypothetical protein
MFKSYDGPFFLFALEQIFNFSVLTLNLLLNFINIDFNFSQSGLNIQDGPVCVIYSVFVDP